MMYSKAWCDCVVFMCKVFDEKMKEVD